MDVCSDTSLVEVFDVVVAIGHQHVDRLGLHRFVNATDSYLVVCEYPYVKEVSLACPGLCKVKHLLKCKQLCNKHFYFAS